jgi:hypothetical protein
VLRLGRALHFLWRVDLPFGEIRFVADLLAAFPGSRIIALDRTERGPPVAVG